MSGEDTREALVTECCARRIAADERYCPKCGWECRITPVSGEDTREARMIADLEWIAENGNIGPATRKRVDAMLAVDLPDKRSKLQAIRRAQAILEAQEP